MACEGSTTRAFTTWKSSAHRKRSHGRRQRRAPTLPNSSARAARRSRSLVIFAETERGRRRGEERFTRGACTVTTPDDGIAKGSAKSSRLLVRFCDRLGGDDERD